MFGVRFATQATYGKNVNNSNFIRTGKRLDQIMKSNADIDIALEYGRKMFNDARANVRVRTGRLQSSIKVERTANGFVFYQDESIADYGKYHEFGTRYIAPKPFMIPAWNRYSGPMIQALKKYYRTGSK